MDRNIRHKRTSEKGSALVYILIAIALLAALTVTFMEPSSQQTTSQSGFKTITAVQGQIDVLRSGIQECVLAYPKGDVSILAATDPGARTNYPIKPNSTHYDGPPLAVIPKTAGRLARDIRCPGQQDGPNVNDHAKIFSGASGKFMPPAPDLFEDWQYYNGADGVFFWTRTEKSDAFLKTALEKLDDKFGECETDIIDTSDAPAGDKDLDSLSAVNCTHPASGSALCFRVWMIQNGSAVFNGDADGDEGGC